MGCVVAVGAQRCPCCLRLAEPSAKRTALRAFIASDELVRENSGDAATVAFAVPEAWRGGPALVRLDCGVGVNCLEIRSCPGGV